MRKRFTFMYESRHSWNYINARNLWWTRVFRELPHPGAKVNGSLPLHPNECLFFFSKHLNWKKNVSQVINMNLSHGQKGFILPTLVTNQNTEFASSCQALYFLPLITSSMDRTLTNRMLLKFLARMAMNGAPTLSNILPLRPESFLFFLSCLNFVIPVRF